MMGRRKVPFIPMMEAAECGAASLAMVLAYWGAWVPLPELREKCAVSRDGSDAQDLRRAAISYGMQAAVVAVDMDELPGLRLPCIVMLNLSHFVVMRELTPKAVMVTDPGVGELGIPMAEFANQFAGIGIVFAPGDDFEPINRRRSLMGSAVSLVGGSLLAMAAVMVMAVLAHALGLMVPLLNRYVFDRAIPSGSKEGLIVIGIVAVVGLIVVSALEIARNLAYRSLRAAVDIAMIKRISTKLFSLPIEYFIRRNYGSIMSRVSMLVPIRGLIGESITAMAVESATIITLAVVAASCGYMYLMVMAVYMLVFFIVQKYLYGRVVAAHNASMAASSGADGVMYEMANTVESVKAMRYESILLNRWAANAVVGHKAEIATGLIHGSNALAVAVMGELLLVVLVLIASLSMSSGLASAGVLVIMMVIGRSLTSSVRSIEAALRTLILASSRMNAMEDIVDEVSEREGGNQLEHMAGKIELVDVEYAYSQKGGSAVSIPNLVIPPGEMIGIVGPSGSGKSTLARLIGGLLAAKSGQIKVDGNGVETLDLAWLRRKIGFVIQESFMFDASVEFNIALGAPLDKSKLERVCKSVGIWEKVASLPEGLETILGGAGCRLSGGEQQRLALARALYKEPSILILDEASSALDLETERFVHESLSELGCTRIVIAHRMATMKAVDRIVVMRRGRIVDIGTFEELVRTNAEFREMCLVSGTIGGGL